MSSLTPTTALNNGAGQITAVVQITTDGVPKLHCPVCNKALVSLNGYVKHIKKHEPPGGFLCRHCDGRFCSEEELKTHRDKVHTIIACRICKTDEATFGNVHDYRQHISSVHNGIDRIMYNCEKCGAEYKTLEPFKRHQETECGTIKPHKCDQCEMAFVTKYNLKQHKETHTGERKFCCSFCGKSFLQKGRLVEHERSHTGQKPYKCDVCGKCFAHRESIVTHSSIHTGIRLVECRCCSSRFSCYSNLIKHRRTRPDTCGLPEYDPPKNRTRIRGSRIPATLNPTSEIKVNNLNKVIKQDSKTQRQRSEKKSNLNEDNKRQPNRKRKSTITDQKESGKKQRKTDILAEVVTKPSDENNKPTISAIDQTISEDFWNNESEDSIDNTNEDPRESDSDMDEKPLTELRASLNKTTSHIKVEQSDELEFLSATADDFEYTNTDLNFHSEDHSNIFNEKNNLIEIILNESIAAKSPIKSEEPLLEETEVLIFKDENQEEDMLALKDTELDCKIVLNDVTQLYPQLKTNRSVRLTRSARTKKQKVSQRKSEFQKGENDDAVTKHNDDNGSSYDEEKEKPKKRKYKQKCKTKNEDGTHSKRTAKLTTAELKQRLKILKRDGKSWPCPYCIKIYYMRKPFERHLREEHKRPEEEIREKLKGDEVGLINEEIFKCHICHKIYLIQKRLTAHLKLHGDDGSLVHKCPCYCNLFFASKDEATRHAQQQHRDALFCDICQKFMNGHEGLKNHMKKHHASNEKEETKTMKRNLVCDKCGKKFSGRTSLTDHVRSDCGRKPLYPCSVCGKHLTTAGILKTHLLLHKDETPYQCDKCGKTFKVKAQYKTHIKTRHTDNKPFKCHLCPKEYPYRESLLIHMTVHTGIKRFLCNGCGKRFTCISNLQAHRKVHVDTCGLLPLNPKATQYMGVQKGNLLLGSKPEAGLDYIETNTLVAKEIIDRDIPMAQELNFPSEPSAPLTTAPIACTEPPLPMHEETAAAIPTPTTSHILLPHLMIPVETFTTNGISTITYN